MTILELLGRRAREQGDASAILALDCAPLSHARLLDLVLQTGSDLRARGIQPDDRVAIVLPNGPEMATAFLAVSSCAVSAPLNPAYRDEEFEFYLSDLEARAVLVQENDDSAAAKVADAMGIPIVELARRPAEAAGMFDVGSRGLPIRAGDAPGADDTALVLHTSGTTSRPKLVPLSHRNLTASARNVAASLALAPDDRCLNVMPLFHIHGLVAAVLASLHAGGSVVCTPGFDAPRFFDWLELCRPTWYTAVPTMHQAVLLQAERRSGLAVPSLRFVRSSSAALAPPVMRELERVFQAPVIEAYGMTEAAHQMACNPLPPRQRKPGTVGVAAGPEVAIMDDRGTLLPAGQPGEVVIRGENVTRGYDRNPSANASAFSHGWFRTGDQGVIDADGYLTLTGRLKEIINRGGEKISPREVDEVLLGHPAVGQAVTFALPDARLGEDVGVAIVLRDGRAASEAEIRAFAALRLAPFKVPRSVIFVSEIPKGPTGKLQRVGLAQKLGITGDTHMQAPEQRPFEAPETAMERWLAGIWAEVLRVEVVGRHDDFLALGGDSILLLQVLSRIRDRFEVEVTPAALFDAPTLAEQSLIVEQLLAECDTRQSDLPERQGP